ncbi:MAG: EamA family transporter [Jiangellaceae bacterium]
MVHPSPLIGIGAPRSRVVASTDRMPPQAFFVTSAIFHYLGPAFAVLLFARVDVLGVAWLRIASAAVIFAAWRRPWRIWAVSTWRQRRLLLALGGVLGVMNCLFYVAIDRLPLGTVGAIEFLGPIVLAAVGIRTPRNAAALVLAVGGVYLLTDVYLVDEPLGLAFAFGNCVLFMAYVVLGHRIALDGGTSGIDRLGAAMVIAMVLVAPVGLTAAAATLTAPILLLAAIGVGVCSSVIPYVCDQLAMARIPRATFALMLALLPATAVVIGLLVLTQIPSWLEVAGVVLVIVGVALHQTAPTPGPTPGQPSGPST